MGNKEVIDSKDLGPTLSALYELDVVKQKLAEKDKEIEQLKEELTENENIIDFHMKNNIYNVILKDYSVLAPYPKNIAQILRHQICEEIRNEAYFDHYTDCDGKTQIVYCIEPEKLKEIEQGENK